MKFCIYTLLSLFCIATLFTSCEKKEKTPSAQQTIKDFAGTWEAPSLSEIFSIGLDEQIKAFKDGTHPGWEKILESMSEDLKGEFEEMLQLPDDEVKKQLMSKGILGGGQLGNIDFKMQFVIKPPSELTVNVTFNGETHSQVYVDAEYELTSKEIICRYDGEIEVFRIVGDQLYVNNNKPNAYPRQIPLSRKP